jgi:sortase A
VFREGDSLLKVGVILSALAIALVIAAAVATVTLRGEEPGWASAAEGAVMGSQKDLQRHSSGEGESATKSSSEAQSRSASNPGGELESNARSESRSESNSIADPGPQAQSEQNSGQRLENGKGSLPAGEGGDWPRPTDEEIEATNDPRHFGLVPGAIMSLTIEKIGIYNAPVFDSESPWALANGIAHVPETSLPWSDTPQRNVYLAGHRMGYRGTWSRMLFYNLDELGEGDKVVLKDRAGHVYEYRVSEVFLAEPTDSWVMGEVKGRDMVSLQTCTPLYTFEKRLIVRADRL